MSGSLASEAHLGYLQKQTHRAQCSELLSSLSLSFSFFLFVFLGARSPIGGKKKTRFAQFKRYMCVFFFGCCCCPSLTIVRFVSTSSQPFSFSFFFDPHMLARTSKFVLNVSWIFLILYHSLFFFFYLRRSKKLLRLGFWSVEAAKQKSPRLFKRYSWWQVQLKRASRRETPRKGPTWGGRRHEGNLIEGYCKRNKKRKTE